MATVTYNATTSTTLASIWKKYQGPLTDAVNFEVEEFKKVKAMKDAKLLPTTREVLLPIRLNRGLGVAAINEGGGKAVPSTQAPVDLSFSLNHYQKRFSLARRVMLIEQNGGSDAEIVKEIKLANLDTISAFAAYLGDQFYAPSTSVRANTATTLAGATTALTLIQGFAQTWITDASYISRLLPIGERVALQNAGTRVTNAVGTIVAQNTSTPTISVAWDGSVPTDPGATLTVTLANSIDNTVDDYNKGFQANLIDICTASSLHGYATSSNALWNVSTSDTTGGRFTGIRLMKAMDGIQNFSPFEADTVILSQGVYRDMVAQYQGALRFATPYDMAIDGSIKAEGVKFFKSRRVPPGLAVVYASDAWQRFFGNPDVEGQQTTNWSDLDLSEDWDRMNATFDWVGNLACKSRQAFAFHRSLTEQ